MVSAQILRSCLNELRDITRVEFCLQDSQGGVVTATSGAVKSEPRLVTALSASMVDSQVVGNTYMLKVLDEDEVAFILSATGSSDSVFMVARMAVSELQHMIAAYKERYDRHNFFQDLLLDNLLLVDVANRARKLHIAEIQPRAIILFEVEADDSQLVRQLLSGIFTTQNGDYLSEVEQGGVILVKSLESNTDTAGLEQAAETAIDMLNMEAMVRARAAFGSIVMELKDLSKSYKEARMALEVGKIFYAERNLTDYNRLGIGRLIYQLPTGLCRIFIREIFGANEEMAFDPEVVATVTTFFENNLNVSETARRLFIHRNTLVYRIEKLQKDTGLDIRRFDDALILQVALMVSSYVRYKSAN